MAAEAAPRKFWLVFGVIVLLLPALHLLRFFTQRSDIWWTPRPLAVPLAQSTDRVEIYVFGQPLREQVVAQRVRTLTDRGPVTPAAADITLRFNNRDRVRADQIPGLLGAAVLVAVVGVFVALSVLGMWPPTRPSVRR